MLALQRHRPTMGSNQPPPDGGRLPFGYAVDTYERSQPQPDPTLSASASLWDFNFAFQPPEPAPGAPLLTNNETSRLARVMDDMTSNEPASGLNGNHNNGHNGYTMFGYNMMGDTRPPELRAFSSYFGQLSPQEVAHSLPNDMAGFANMGQIAPGPNATRGTDVINYPMQSPQTPIADAMPSSFAMSTSMMTPSIPITTAPGMIATSATVTSPVMSLSGGAPGSFDTSGPMFSAAINSHVNGSSNGTYATPGGITATAMPMHLSPIGIGAEKLSDDLVEAAEAILGKSPSRPNSMHNDNNFPNFSNTQGMDLPTGPLRHQQWSEFEQEGQRMLQSTHEAEQQQTMQNWIMNGSRPHQSGPRPAPPPMPIGLQYGSDQSFSNNNQPFAASPEKDITQEISETHLRYMDCVQLSNSAENSRQSSPAFGIDTSSIPFHLKTRDSSEPLAINLNRNGKRRRRTQTNNTDEHDNQEGHKPASSNGATRKRKVGAVDSPPGPVDAGSGKRRKSTVKKENLTEEQKRQNHINSEKKRRHIIATGFENLTQLIPANKAGNPSKSQMIEATVVWLEDLLKGNAHLKEQMSQMQSGN